MSLDRMLFPRKSGNPDEKEGSDVSKVEGSSSTSQQKRINFHTLKECQDSVQSTMIAIKDCMNEEGMLFSSGFEVW